MAKNYRGSGDTIDIPYVIQTGVTITGGSMIFVDVSGTDVIHRVSALAESTGFYGVLSRTQTGAQTGATIHRRGIFEFQTLAAATGAEVQVGQPVWAGDNGTVRGFGTTAATLTGHHPVGICVFLPEGRDETATSVRAHVDIYPDRLIPFSLGESATNVV